MATYNHKESQSDKYQRIQRTILPFGLDYR